MNTIIVWTKQHENVIKELDKTGRYIAKKEYISKDLEEHAPLVLEVYHWLVKNSPDFTRKPKDAEYPIWVSLSQEATMLPSKGAVILKLALAPSLVTMVNIEKWGTILNYSYIPENVQDDIRHKQLLREYGISDTQAYMSQFYPQIKREIIHSWSRLFDNSIILGNNNEYGNIWEVKKEWVLEVIE